METLLRGASGLYPRQFLQADRTALLVSALTTCVCQLSQNGTTIATYTRGTDNQLRTNPASTSGVLLEITPAVSANLTAGPLTEKWTWTVADTDYVAASNVRTVVLEFSNIVVR